MLRANGGAAVGAALNSGKKKKPNRENAYMLFSKAVREDMYQKFGGLQAFNEHFVMHYQNEQDEGRVKIPPVKMAVIGNMWSEAPPGVKSFFERAAERKNAWDDAKVRKPLEIDDAFAQFSWEAKTLKEFLASGEEGFYIVTLASETSSTNRYAVELFGRGTEGLAQLKADIDDEDVPIGRTRPPGGGKARKIDKNTSIAASSTVPVKDGTTSPPVDTEVDFEAQEKTGSKELVKQAAKKSTPVETVVTRVADTRREISSRSESKDPDTPNTIKVGAADGGKRGLSVLESLPIASDTDVVPDASSKIFTEVTGGDQAAGFSAKNEAKHRESREDTDAAGEQKSATGVPRDGKASERNVHGASKGPDKGKAPGEGKQADEEEDAAKAKDETGLQSAGVSEGARSGGREHDDRAVDKCQEKGASKGGNSQKAKAPSNTNATGKADDIGASSDIDKAEAVGGGAEKATKDDQKSSATGTGTSGERTTGKNDKNDKKETSLGKGRGDLPASSEGKDKNDRRESSRESSGGAKTKGPEEKRGEMAAAIESYNAEERSRDKGKGREKAKSTEKRKSNEGKNIKGANKGAQGGRISSVKPRANPVEEAKEEKDPRRAPTTKGSQRKEARNTNQERDVTSTKRKEARKQASSVSIASRGRRGNKEAANAETNDDSTLTNVSVFGLERGERVAIEVEWPVEVQKSGRKSEERLEWFSATVNLLKQLRTDDEGRPKWIISYARHGSLPASKSKVTFLSEDRLMDDFEDDPLRWRKKGITVPTSEADSSPRRAGSAGSSVGSSADHEVEWRDDFGLKPRRRS